MKPKKNNIIFQAIGIGVLFAIVVYTIPALISSLHIAFLPSYNNDNSSKIGDSIGGMTAPIIGIISSLLVFYSFREQVKANKLVQEQINEESISRNSQFYFDKINHYNNIITQKTYPLFNKDTKGSIDTLLINLARTRENILGHLKKNKEDNVPKTDEKIISYYYHPGKPSIDDLGILIGFVFQYCKYLNETELRIDKMNPLISSVSVFKEELQMFISSNMRSIDVVLVNVEEQTGSGELGQIDLIIERIKYIKSFSPKQLTA
ncbi:hypothetical protein F0919_17745 [Taibaiella lutea]|uniref:Phage abortive infection protein n=1 Tax=Taibaiella lutea TaxID=2608001 RepID=A0A5M6CGT0_9BACT|nr:hypothetical protein [Taibaiella lutea]KAA5532625.1 hypothetical protein F0919_17745 [Taibaiella lutea]